MVLFFSIHLSTRTGHWKNREGLATACGGISAVCSALPDGRTGRLSQKGTVQLQRKLPKGRTLFSHRGHNKIKQVTGACASAPDPIVPDAL